MAWWLRGFIGLQLLLLGVLGGGLCAFDHLVWMPRRPSRHTRGFDIVGASLSYTLPMLELQAAVEAAAAAALTSPLQFQSILPGVAYELRPPEALAHEHLEQAVRRAVLTWGLFRVLAQGPEVASVMVMAAAASSLRSSVGGCSWRVGVVEMGPPGPGKEGIVQEDELRSLLLNELGLDPALELPNERLAPDLDLLFLRLPADTSTSSHRLLLCRRLAKGLAVGQGYAYAETPRRPRAGVLKLLTQHCLAQQAVQTPTAMEPEIALVMASLARIGAKGSAGGRVLDPFVGGGSLLMAAGLLGAAELIGTDAAKELVGEGAPARTAALESFAALSPLRQMVATTSKGKTVAGHFMPKPLLLACDIRDFRQQEYAGVFRRAYYDAVITDPPYSIKEKVRGGGDANGVDGTEREDVMTVLTMLLELAGHVLAPGGRLVCFLPAWGLHGLETVADRKGGRRLTKAALGPSPPPSVVSASELWGQWNGRILAEQSVLLGQLPSLGLKLVGAQPQVFSPTFLRWLVCIEKT